MTEYAEKRRSPSPLLVAALLAFLHLAAAGPLIVTGHAKGPTAADQNEFHLPTIRQFARELPRPELTDYPSATTPGYHLLMAALAVGGGDPHVGTGIRMRLQCATALMSAGMLATLGGFVARRLGNSRRPSGGWEAIALCLPFACSPYVFAAGVWLVPHNLAWWGVLGIVLLSLRRTIDRRAYVLGGTLLAGIVFSRQIHLWVAAALWIAAWMGSAADAQDASERTSSVGRAARMGAVFLATLPALLILGYFYRTWHGLTPPGEPWARSAISPAVPAVILSLLGVYGMFFLPCVPPETLRAQCSAKRMKWVVIGALLGVATGLLPTTTYDVAAGRWSGIWNVVRHLPAPFGRSPLIVALAALGGAVLATWLLIVPSSRTRIVAAVALAAFMAAHLVVGQTWQRYYEPFILMWLTLMTVAARSDDGGGSRVARWGVLGPLFLALGLAGMTTGSLW